MELFLPLPLGPEAVNARYDENYNLMGRLKPGVTIEQAQADLSVIAARIRDRDKRDRTFTISVVPLVDQVVGNVRRTLWFSNCPFSPRAPDWATLRGARRDVASTLDFAENGRFETHRFVQASLRHDLQFATRQARRR
jgi:hypothetical protein